MHASIIICHSDGKPEWNILIIIHLLHNYFTVGWGVMNWIFALKTLSVSIVGNFSSPENMIWAMGGE